MFANIGYIEILIILVILVVVFGGKNLSKIMSSLSKSTKQLKNSNQALKNALAEKKSS